VYASLVIKPDCTIGYLRVQNFQHVFAISSQISTMYNYLVATE
jgi:hypothetical protein